MRASARAIPPPPQHRIAQRLLAVDAREHRARRRPKSPKTSADVLDRVERRGVDDRRGRADRGRDLEAGHPPHQLVAALPVLDQVGDRDDLAARAPRRTPGSSRQPLDRAVVVDQLREHADASRRRPGGRGRSPPRCGPSGPARRRRGRSAGKMCPGRTKSSATDIAVGQRADRAGALLGRDAGGQAEAVVDRDRERGLQRRVVDADHRLQAQPRARRRRSAACTGCRWCGGP